MPDGEIGAREISALRAKTFYTQAVNKPADLGAMRQVTESVKTFALRTQVIHTLRTTFKPVSKAKTQHLVFMKAEQHNILCDSALTLLAGVVIFIATSASGIQTHIEGLDPSVSITSQHADLAPKALPSKGFVSVLVVIAAL